MSGAPATAAKVGSQSSWDDDAVERRACREVTGPADEGGHAVGAFPVGVLLAAEGHRAGIGPGVVVRAVVGGVLDDRVVGEAEVVDQLEQLADVQVVLDHAVGVFVVALVTVRSAFTCVRKCMRVPFHQQKKGCPALAWRVMKSFAAARVSSSMVSMRFFVSRPVFSMRLAALAVRPGVQHAARTELLDEGLAAGHLHVGGVVLVLRLLLGVEVVEVAEELVEPVHGGQVLVTVALVVLAELAGGVALALQHRGHGDVGLSASLPSRRAARPWSCRCGRGRSRR